MNIIHMKAFLEVARTGNFQVASENLHITQSTVSARIRVLEEQLRTTLLYRKREGSELTPAGRNFIRYAETSVRAWEQAKQEITRPDTLECMVSLGVQMNMWQEFAPAWIDEMNSRAEDVGTRVVMDYSENLLVQLSDESLDLALTYIPREKSNTTSKLLLEDRLVLVSSEPRKVSYEWLEDYVFVDWGFEFRTEHERTYSHLAAPKVSVGLGVIGLDYILRYGGSGYFPERMVRQYTDRQRLHFVTGAPEFVRPVYVSYPVNPVNPELINLSLDCLTRVVASQFADS